MIRASPVIDAASGTREVVLQLAPGSTAHPRQQRDGAAGRRAPAGGRPSRSGGGQDGYALVWDDHRTTLRAVTLGRRLAGDRVEVVSGLAAGEKVVPGRAMSARPGCGPTSCSSSRPTAASRASSSRTPRPRSISASGRSRRWSCSRRRRAERRRGRGRADRGRHPGVGGRGREVRRQAQERWGCCERTLGERSVLHDGAAPRRAAPAAQAAPPSRATSSASAGPWATPTSFMDRTMPYLRLPVHPRLRDRLGRRCSRSTSSSSRPSGRSSPRRSASCSTSAIPPATLARLYGSPAPSIIVDPRAGPRLHLQALRRPGARDRRDAAVLRAGLLLQRERRLELPRAQGAAVGHGGRLVDPARPGEPRGHRLVGRHARTRCSPTSRWRGADRRQ